MIKVGCKGVFISQTCLHDANVKIQIYKSQLSKKYSEGSGDATKVNSDLDPWSIWTPTTGQFGPFCNGQFGPHQILFVGQFGPFSWVNSDLKSCQFGPFSLVIRTLPGVNSDLFHWSVRTLQVVDSINLVKPNQSLRKNIPLELPWK